MLSINKVALSPPSRLEIGLIPAAAAPTGPLSRLKVQAEWPDASLWQRLLSGERRRNPDVALQVPLNPDRR